MRIKKVFKLKERFIALGLFLFFLLPVLHTKDSFAEISTDSYCQLSVLSLLQQVSSFQQLIPIANQYKNDPATFTEQEKIKQAELEENMNALFSSYGVTASEYALYMGEHKQEVEQYIVDHPDVKQQLDYLKAQALTLTEQYEALKLSILKP